MNATNQRLKASAPSRRDQLRRYVILRVALAFAAITLISGATFALLPGQLPSAVILSMSSLPSLMAFWLARRERLNAAAALLAVVLWLALVAEPFVTGNISTNAFFMGLLAILLLGVLPLSTLWVAPVAAVVSVGILAWVSNGDSTPDVPWPATLVNAALLLLATGVALGVALQAARWQLRQVLTGQVSLEEQIRELRDTVGTLESLVANRTAHLRLALEERERVADQLREWSSRDALTSLRNRRFLNDRLSQLASPEARRPLTLMVIDMDHFKEINDAFGHATGDQILHQVGVILGELAPTGATAARYGGEEFVLLVHLSESEAINLGEAIRNRISRSSGSAETLPRVTASLGLAVSGADPGAAMRAAFQAMQLAKRKGRNRLEVYRNP